VGGRSGEARNMFARGGRAAKCSLWDGVLCLRQRSNGAEIFLSLGYRVRYTCGSTRQLLGYVLFLRGWLFVGRCVRLCHVSGTGCLCGPKYAYRGWRRDR